MTAQRVGGQTRETPAEKRIRKAREAAAAGAGTKARRGDTDEPQEETSKPGVPHQESPSPAVIEPGISAVTTDKEASTRNGFHYSRLPDSATDLEKLAHAQRGIVDANRAATQGVGKLQSDYVLSAGRYLWDATEEKWYKAAGHKSVEAFAETLGLERRDVYRLRDAVPVYLEIWDLVEEPLSERTIRELAIAARNGGCREVFTEMKRVNRISAAGAVDARKLLAAGDLKEIIQADPGNTPEKPPVERLNQARKGRKLVDLDLLQEVAAADRTAAEEYVNELKQQYEAAAKIVGS